MARSCVLITVMFKGSSAASAESCRPCRLHRLGSRGPAAAPAKLGLRAAASLAHRSAGRKTSAVTAGARA